MLDRSEEIDKKIDAIKNMEFPIIGAKPLKLHSLYLLHRMNSYQATFEIPTDGVLEVRHLSILINPHYVNNQPLNNIYNLLYNGLVNGLGMDRAIIDSPLHKAIYG